MSQLAVQLSNRADALIAQLQKELFNRRRKKVTPAGVVESLVESAARSPNDKRFATAWKNLVADIDKAAKAAAAHGLKPANLSDAEWALVLQHRTRQGTKALPAAKTPAKAKASPSVKAPAKAKAQTKPSAAPAKATKASAAKPKATKSPAKAAAKAAAKPEASAVDQPTKASAAARPAARRASPRKKAASTSLTTRMAAASKAAPRRRTKAAAGKAALPAAPTLSSNGLALASPL